LSFQMSALPCPILLNFTHFTIIRPLWMGVFPLAYGLFNDTIRSQAM
jgi:hypothetical protein